MHASAENGMNVPLASSTTATIQWALLGPQPPLRSFAVHLWHYTTSSKHTSAWVSKTQGRFCEHNQTATMTNKKTCPKFLHIITYAGTIYFFVTI